MFLAVGHNGLRITSTDGVEWKNPQLGKEGETFRAAAFGNGVFVAVGSFGGKNMMAATHDGVEWKTSGNDAKYSRYFRGIVFGHGQFLALGGDPVTVGVAKPFVSTSTDGVQWSELKDISGRFIIRRVAMGNDRVVGVGDRGRRAFSKDGLTWEDAPNTKAIDTLVDIAFGNGTFVGVGLHGMRTTTTDGVTWSEPLRGQEGEHLNSVVWAKDHFVAVGAGATWISPDAVKWERRPNQDAPLNCVFGNGVFVGSKWKGRILRSTDGVKWIQVFKSEFHVEAVATQG
jgi:hypothetical protein